MTNNDASVWGLHTGRPRGQSREIHQQLELQTDKLFKQGYVALGWPQLGDLSALAADREAFKQQYRAVYGQDAPARSMETDVSLRFRFLGAYSTLCAYPVSRYVSQGAPLMSIWKDVDSSAPTASSGPPISKLNGTPSASIQVAKSQKSSIGKS